MKKIGLSRRPDSISQKQAAAAVGQCSYACVGKSVRPPRAEGGTDSHHPGRLQSPRPVLNARNTLFTLLSWRSFPSSTRTTRWWWKKSSSRDNDSLSAMVTDLLDAHFLVMLTDEKASTTKTPIEPRGKADQGRGKVSRGDLKYAASKPGSLGTGGMESKIRQVKKRPLPECLW